MPFGRKSPLETLALPGVMLAYKYSQFRQKRREAASRRITERELTALHHKIDKLLNKLEESEMEPPTSQEDECVICITAKATMQTSPCGHCVVCRRCFVKTIQSAVAQRLLPLRCVICRTRVSRLTTGSGTFRLQSSSSSYSVETKSWNVSGSSSSYSVGSHVAPSSSLCSMSSGSSNLSHNSKISNVSMKSGMSSTSISSTAERAVSGQSNPGTRPKSNHHVDAGVMGSMNHTNHTSHKNCPAGCMGAIPRNPIQYSYRQYHHKQRFSDMPIRLPPIKEYKSPSRLPAPTQINPQYNISLDSYMQSTNILEKQPISINGDDDQAGTHSQKFSVSKLGMTSKVSPITILGRINSNSLPSAKLLYVASAKPADRVEYNKIDNADKKKKEEKLRIKHEKEARREEKRKAKEDERISKLRAKEEKKRAKKEAKELLIFPEVFGRK